MLRNYQGLNDRYRIETDRRPTLTIDKSIGFFTMVSVDRLDTFNNIYFYAIKVMGISAYRDISHMTKLGQTFF